MEVAAVEGLMQDYELSLQHVLWRIERLHQKREVVTKRDEGIHRITYGEMVPRINRLAGALKQLGVKPGDRVATLAWNNSRHLELYYAVPCMGAVLHTLNLRLFPQHLEFIINDAEDKVLFVDQSLLPLLKPLIGKIPSIKTYVLMAEGNPAAADGMPAMLDYETLLAAESESYPWPKISERMAAAADGGHGLARSPDPPRLGHDRDLAPGQRRARGRGNQGRRRAAAAPDPGPSRAGGGDPHHRPDQRRGAAVGRRRLRRDPGARAVDRPRLPQRLRPGQADRGRLVSDRRRGQDQPRGLHPDRRPH